MRHCERKSTFRACFFTSSQLEKNTTTSMTGKVGEEVFGQGVAWVSFFPTCGGVCVWHENGSAALTVWRRRHKGPSLHCLSCHAMLWTGNLSRVPKTAEKDSNKTHNPECRRSSEWRWINGWIGGCMDRWTDRWMYVSGWRLVYQEDSCKIIPESQAQSCWTHVSGLPRTFVLSAVSCRVELAPTK